VLDDGWTSCTSAARPSAMASTSFMAAARATAPLVNEYAIVYNSRNGNNRAAAVCDLYNDMEGAGNAALLPTGMAI
jgi:cystathionine beta-lyase/cystathionine gamma-synthase